MKKALVIPETYEQDYPPKVFRFTGEWSCQPKYSSRNVARRNNPNVWLPIFKADDGQIVCLTWLRSEICPTKHAPDVVESTASVSISTASEVSASEADSSPATTQVM